MYQMVRTQHIDIDVHTCATVTAVYALLRDGASWPGWTSIESFQLEQAGEQEPEGVGAVRIFRKGGVTGRQSAQGLASYAQTTTLA